MTGVRGSLPVVVSAVGTPARAAVVPARSFDGECERP